MCEGHGSVVEVRLQGQRREVQGQQLLYCISVSKLAMSSPPLTQLKGTIRSCVRRATTAIGISCVGGKLEERRGEEEAQP